MKKQLPYYLFLFFSYNCFAQLYLNNGGKIYINGGTLSSPVFVVLNSPPSTPIVTNGTGNGIIMEDEYNRLQYNLGTATTSITVPYMSTALEAIPLTFSPTSAGSGSGNIRFSAKVPTTRLNGYDNISFLPSGVTNMSALPNISNNSAKTIDRFWIIDANGYTTKPAVNLSFTYIDAEWASNGGNSITESELRAQRFNNTSGINDWEGTTAFPPAGTIDITSNTVSNVSVSAANFFKVWTLNASSVPLPIELINFTASCKNNKTEINWSTISETNNDYFTLEKSFDGSNYYEIALIEGAGNSTQINNYSYSDEALNATAYYRLKQTDFNGTINLFGPVSSNCDGKTHEIMLLPNPNHGFFTVKGLQNNQQIIITDVLGKTIFKSEVMQENMEIQLPDLASGVYNFQVIDEHQLISKKLIIN
jgi:hypothetical protein